MIWKHGLRGAVQSPSMFSPLDYKAGQRQAYSTGDEARSLFEKVVATAVGVNSFWSSSKVLTGSSESFGSYKRLPRQCLWQLLLRHALPSASTPDASDEITVTPSIQEQNTASGAIPLPTPAASTSAPAKANGKAKQSPLKRFTLPTAEGIRALFSPRRPKSSAIQKKQAKATSAKVQASTKAQTQRVTSIKTTLAKSRLMRSQCLHAQRQSRLMRSQCLHAKRRRLFKKTKEPVTQLEQTVPVTEAATTTPCPNATVTSTQVTTDLEESSKSLLKIVPWPPFPEHSFNVSGSLDFSQVFFFFV